MSFHPQTPQSPSQFSPITSDPLSGTSNASVVTTTNSINTNVHGGGSFSSASAATPSTLPTPAHSVNGSGSGFGSADAVHGMSPGSADSPHKRKRQLDDAGDHGHGSKKVHMEGQQRLDFEALHQDVGEKYLVCNTRKTPSPFLSHLPYPVTPSFHKHAPLLLCH